MFPIYKFIMVMRNCMVSMQTLYAILKKWDVLKTHISVATHPRTFYKLADDLHLSKKM